MYRKILAQARRFGVPGFTAGFATAVLSRVVLVRLAALTATTAAGTILGLSIVGTPTAPLQACAPVKQAWLTHVGSIAVERVPVPRTYQQVDLCKPPVAVAHTVEGSLAGGLSVFREHYAPTFLIGRDSAGKIRVLQFAPIGEMAAALKNAAGGVETNRWARVQVELAGYSKSALWLPDAGVTKTYAQLMLALRDVAGIPLRHPFADQMGSGAASYSYARRLSGKWGKEAGWFNHAEVPENNHWDSGSLRFAELFGIALASAPVVNPGHTEPTTTTSTTGTTSTTSTTPTVPDAEVTYRVLAWKRGGEPITLLTTHPAVTVSRLKERGMTHIDLWRVATR